MSMNSIGYLQNWRAWSGCNVRYQDSFGDKEGAEAKNKSLQYMWQEAKEFQKKRSKPKLTIVMLEVHDT